MAVIALGGTARGASGQTISFEEGVGDYVGDSGESLAPGGFAPGASPLDIAGGDDGLGQNLGAIDLADLGDDPVVHRDVSRSGRRAGAVH